MELASRHARGGAAGLSSRAAGAGARVPACPAPARAWKRRSQAPTRCQASALHTPPPLAASPSGRGAGALQTADLSCELLQGNMVHFSAASDVSVPTAVLVHGILGSRRNLQSFARMIVQGFPTWQVLLVDLRCHGDSAAAAGAPPAPGPHTVESAALDVLELLRRRRAFPNMLIGHSFGGKVVMSMCRQFGGPGAVLPRPVQVWVLDAPPGAVSAGGGGAAGAAAGDEPARLIRALQGLRMPLAARSELIDHLTAAGFSLPVARWMTTNLRPAGGGGGDGISGGGGDGGGGGLTWSFDLEAIGQMFESYQAASLWDLLRAPPLGLRVDFVKATRSGFGWGDGAEDGIRALGHRVHPVEAGHWVHSDAPGALFDIIAPTLGEVDLHLQRSQMHTSSR